MKTKKELWEVYTQSSSDLVREVVLDVLDNCNTDDEVQNYLNQVVTIGGINAAIPSLIYFTECEAFVKKNLVEILSLYDENKEFIDPKQTIDVSFLSWYSYEYICNRILDGTVEDFNL